MDRSAILWAARLVTGGIGVVLMFGAIRLLGRARAAASWPTAPPVFALARPLGWAGVAAGLAGLATASALSLAALTDPGPVPGNPRAWLLATAGGLAVLLAGLGATGPLVGRAELAVLIRTRRTGDHPASPIEALLPAQPSDRDVPAAGQPGWVYQDMAGDWYLAVATGTGPRLVRLTDFTLVPAGTPEPPLELKGSVEITVYPVSRAGT